MIEYQSLGDLLLGRTAREKLQQGWSPQCERHPAVGDRWGVLKTTAIQAGAFSSNENKELPSELVPRPALEVSQGDLLLTCAGPRSRCGVPALVRSTQARRMLSGKMYRFRPTAAIDPRYLEAYLLSPGAQKLIDAMKTGISDSGLNLTKDRFLGLPVPVVPLREQLRIVDILEGHLSRLDAAEASVKRAERLTSALVSSILATSLDLGPGSDEVVRISDALIESRGGWSRSRQHTVAASTGTPYLKMNNITRQGSLHLEDVIHVQASREDISRYGIRNGDVLFNSKNSGDLVGKTAVADSRVEGWVFNENIIRLRFDARLRPEFVGLWFRGPSMRRQIMASARASTNVAAVYMHAMRGFDLWIPSLEKQAQVILECSGLEAGAQRLQSEAATARRRIERLRRALLAIAFSGRLTGRSSDLDRAEELELS